MPLILTHEIFIEVPVPPAVTEPGLAALIAFGLDAEAATAQWHIELVLGDDALLQRLHREFMGLDSPTDIITFPEHDDLDDPGQPKGGQMYISVERADAQAVEYGHQPADEIRFLVLHGILHLCGWSDDTDAGRTAMLARQTQLLRVFDRPGG
ncbi:MAG: rRNA maturation RNase YbeY [Chloroflexota bacterium]|nr:rRNA maturation RNase YbeY [Chloroflexota bacterium]